MPLNSLRILDLTRLLPGPYCSLFFSDFGAEVIKIEEPNRGDYVRWNEPKVDENSATFHSLNRNKKSLTLNLKSSKGKEVFQKLVKTSDIVIESFRPGVMKRLGLEYEKLELINSALIYCAITGYGQDGPYAQMPGHDINYLSYAGLLELQGSIKGQPILPAVQIGDIGGGAQMGVIGILIALQARNQNGKGQFIDISMTDGIISWMQTILPNFLVNKKLPRRGKLKLGGERASYQVYETADNRYLSVGALEDKFWKVFCTEINYPQLIPRLNSNIEEQQQMIREISIIIKRKPLDKWMKIFEGKEACVSPVLNMEEMMNDPQIKSRNMIIDRDHPSGNLKHIGIPIRLSKTPGSIRNNAPNLGEHTKEILIDLGYCLSEIEDWKKEGII